MKLKIFYILISLKMCQILENSVVIYLNSELLYLKFIVFADSSIVKNSNKRLQSLCGYKTRTKHTPGGFCWATSPSIPSAKKIFTKSNVNHQDFHTELVGA